MTTEQLNELNKAMRKYDFKHNTNLLIGYEDGSGQWQDLIIYDTDSMLEQPQDYEDFVSIVNENLLNFEDFEIDRISLYN